MNKEEILQTVETLQNGKIAVFKSDTLYGIHAKAENAEAVEKIYQLKEREENKPFIILISNIKQLKLFDTEINSEAENIIKKYWPGKLTIILKAKNIPHLTREGKTLAFRLPRDKGLRKIIEAVGPIVSTTVNKSGDPAAITIEEAKNLFGDKIDLYVDSGKTESTPSTLVDCSEGTIKILRSGAVKLPQNLYSSYNLGMRKIVNVAAAIAIFVLIAAGVLLNIKEQKSIDHSKLPEKVENSNGFQRWITNLKNNDFVIEADEFVLKEENEIYNTKWITVSSIDDDGMKEKYDKTIEAMQDVRKVVFSPSGREFIDYRNEYRDGYQRNEAHFYGLKEDKIIDARILDCSLRANCFFDRAYFLDNDLFVISEFSRNIDKKDETAAACATNENCEYTIKIHVIDLINNKRLVYESRPFTIALSEIAPQL